MSNSLSVLEVTPRYPPFIGGTENHVYQVSQRLAKAGAAITVLTTNPGGRLESFEIVEGVKIHRVPAWPANRDYYFAPGVLHKIVNGHWDIVHVQSYHTLVPPLAILAALHSRIPYIVTFHGGGHTSRVRNALRRVQRRLLRPLLVRANRLIAVAQFEIEFYSQELHIPKRKFCLIPNGTDLPLRSNTASSAGNHRTLIASVGRLEQYKGHHRIIAALPQLIELIPDIHLWIAGTGPYESKLRGLAKKLGVEERVEIRAISPMAREKMVEELSKAALVVLLSEYETHPISILEAIALGKPTLVADTSGLSEIAARGLARAISLTSSANEIATAAAEQILYPPVPVKLRLPTWDECSTNLLELYQCVVEEAQCAS